MVNTTADRSAVDPEVGRRVRDTIGALEGALADALTVARREGQLGADKDPVALARFLVSTSHGLRISGMVQPDRAALASVVEVALGCLD